MTEAKTLAAQAEDDAALMAAQLVMLGDLAQIGLRLSREIERQASDPAPDEARLDAEAAGRTFAKVSRAVRLSLMLQKSLIEARRRAAEEPCPERTARKAQVQRIIARVAEHERPGARERFERLAAERLERDFAGDILDQPVSDLIDLICRDLGLNPQWPRLAQEAWARDEMAGGEPGRPLAALALGTSNLNHGDAVSVQARRRPPNGPSP